MTESTDPLASPTLAQLYVAQGHFGKARRVLASLLASDPFNGPALALQQRLTLHFHAMLTVQTLGQTPVADEQEIANSAVPEPLHGPSSQANPSLSGEFKERRQHPPMLLVRWKFGGGSLPENLSASADGAVSVLIVTHSRRSPKRDFWPNTTPFRSDHERQRSRQSVVESRVTSFRCRSESGEWRIRQLEGTGAACVALARLRGGALEILAHCEPIAYGDPREAGTNSPMIVGSGH